MVQSMVNLRPTFSQFSASNGKEVFITIEAPAGLSFIDSILSLFTEYARIMKENDLNRDTEVYNRFYLSDIYNQAGVLRQYLYFTKKAYSSFYSFIGQPPASGSKILMTAYHIKASKPIHKVEKSHGVLSVKHGPYESIWLNNKPQTTGSSSHQTREIFRSLSNKLNEHQARVRDHLFRTWCYIRDGDNNYQGFVDARRDFFASVGLTEDTHFIASTGIESTNEKPTDIVTIDALAILGLDPSQVEYMNALEYLCPTHNYNVSFERATSITYGDRTHYYISGTASIDHKGNVLHEGNVIKQAQRTLENINALLTSYSSELRDTRMLTVYLRDTSDYDCVNAFLKENIPEGIPYIIVRGAVCRPSWLIEIDGIAISAKANKMFSPFCGV